MGNEVGPGTTTKRKFPAQVDALIKSGLAEDVALRFMRKCGGLQILIPIHPAKNHLLVLRCGMEDSLKLSAIAPGLMLNVPRGNAMKYEARNTAIRRDYDAGVSVNDLVDKYDLVTATIRKILAG